MAKNVRHRPTTSTTSFTRSEFQLLTSLLEDEQNGDLAKTNSRYSATLADLHQRLTGIAYPIADGFATDAVRVAA